MWYWIIGSVLWVIAGAVCGAWSVESQCRRNGGSAEFPPHVWWEWPIMLPFLACLCSLVIIWMLIVATLYCLSFGAIDLEP